MFDHLILILSALGAKVPIYSDILAQWVTENGCVTELMRETRKAILMIDNENTDIFFHFWLDWYMTGVTNMKY